MDIVTPEIGMVFWTTVAFVLLLFILGKYAWKPIMAALREREQSIEDALLAAEKAKEEMVKLNNESDRLIKEARAERDQILKEAKATREGIINEAKQLAQTEGARLIAKAKEEIDTQKAAALAEVKNQVALLSLEIAEKVIGKQFEDQKKQENLVSDLLENMKLN